MAMRTIQRMMSTNAKAVKYAAHGAPQSVLRVESEAVATTVGAQEVLVKMKAFPITHGDFRQVEGYSGGAPGAVAGTEGVGTVLKVGSGVKNVAVNDTVVSTVPTFGTWREMAVVSADSVNSVPSTLPLSQAALLGPTTCTALRLISDFANLSAGDWIIQNGAHGPVGQAVAQLAKAKGLKSINVVRAKIASEDHVGKMQALGADIVIPESYLMTPEYKRLVAELPAPKLGLNCVGGDAATNMARALGDGASMVTYGGYSRNAVTVPTGALVSKDLTLSGFCYARWAKGTTAAERDAMVKELVALAGDGKLGACEAEEHSFADFQKALEQALSGYYANDSMEFYDKKVLVTL